MVTSTSELERVIERRRAVALSHHYRYAEGLSIVQIAERLGRSPATVKAYFYDPTWEKARAVKARYVGLCRGCGAYTQPNNGKGDAYRYCKRCHPGAIQRTWTRELVIAAMLDWCERYGRLPSSYDWSRTHAKRRGGVALKRLRGGPWPSASAVGRLFGTWRVAREAVRVDAGTSTPAAPEHRNSGNHAREGNLKGVRAKPDESLGAVAAAPRLDRTGLPSPLVQGTGPSQGRAPRARRGTARRNRVRRTKDRRHPR